MKRSLNEAALPRTALFTGLRQGEPPGLQRQDETTARRRPPRPAAALTRLGQYAPPKTKAAVRRIPLSDEMTRELAAFRLHSRYSGDDDPVFAAKTASNSSTATPPRSAGPFTFANVSTDRAAGEAERAAFRVAADRPLLAWVDDLASEFDHSNQRGLDVRYGEVGGAIRGRLGLCRADGRRVRLRLGASGCRFPLRRVVLAARWRGAPARNAAPARGRPRGTRSG